MSDTITTTTTSDAQRSKPPFDQLRLAAYLGDKIPGFDGAFDIQQFQGGQSNPTYRISTHKESYVLRKKPAGNLLPSAHAIDREYRIMRALEHTVPVPRMLHYCDDQAVIGEAFYVMEYMKGRGLADARMLDAKQAERRELSFELVRVLARLHNVDYKAVGLEGFGKPDNYVARQLSRWSKQYSASRIEANTDMDRLIPWLETHLPNDEAAAIVHGDYRSHNVIYAENEPKLIAVLDWELATIGHPLADLAYCCLPYYMAEDDLKGFQGQHPSTLGIPTEAEMMTVYADASGRSEIANWHFFLVFSLFRTAAIRAGVFKRAHDGTAANPSAMAAGERYRGAARRAWQLAEAGP